MQSTGYSEKDREPLWILLPGRPDYKTPTHWSFAGTPERVIASSVSVGGEDVRSQAEGEQIVGLSPAVRGCSGHSRERLP